MTADDKYSLCYMENIRQTIQMQLSKKETFFPEPFAVFLKSTTSFAHFEKKKMTLIAYVFPKLWTAKDVVR